MMVGNQVGNKINKFRNIKKEFKITNYIIDIISVLLVAGRGLEPLNLRS